MGCETMEYYHMSHYNPETIIEHPVHTEAHLASRSRLCSVPLASRRSSTAALCRR
jgi:hypothetical protein